MKNQPPCRVLFIGGEKKNLPLKRLYQAERLGLLRWDHRTGLKKGKLSFGSGEIPTVAFIFVDFIGHAAENMVTPKLKTLGVDIVKGSGGFPNLLRIAGEKGHDYIVKVLSNRQDEKPKLQQSLDIRPSGEAPFIKLVDINNRTFRITQKNGVLTLIVKENLLNEVNEYAQNHNLGKGKRGGVLPMEARELVEYLEVKYGFSLYGIHINPVSVQKNVNLIRGSLTPKAAAAATRKGKKAVSKERSVRREEISKETSSLSEEGKIVGTAVEIFLSEMATTMKVMATFPDKYEKLFGRILDLEETNRLLGDENEGLKRDLKSAIEDRNKWKKIATEESP